MYTINHNNFRQFPRTCQGKQRTKMVKRFEALACGGILAITRTGGEGEGHLIHPSVRGKLGAERCSALQPGDHEGRPYGGDGHLIRHSVRTGPPERLAGSENPVGLALFLGIFDRCGKRALPASATGSGRALSHRQRKAAILLEGKALGEILCQTSLERRDAQDGKQDRQRKDPFRKKRKRSFWTNS